MGEYKYESGNSTFKGSFNIYQAKSGAIMLVMGRNYMPLTHQQVNDLSINCYELEDFNYSDIKNHYKG